MRFSERETYLFVKAYFRQENLWNTKHLAYKSNERRLVAYNAVIEDFQQSTGLQLNLTDLRIKIKNLKSTYSQELEKIRRRSNPDYTYKPTMKWFAVWDKHIKSKKASLEESNTTDDENHKSWLPIDEDNDNSVDPFETHQSNEYVMLIKPEPPSKHRESKYNRNRNKLELSDSIEMSDLSTDYLNTTNLLKEDEFDIFGKYIASQLRNMDIQRALTLQIEIQNMVSGARLADLSGRSSST